MTESHCLNEKCKGKLVRAEPTLDKWVCIGCTDNYFGCYLCEQNGKVNLRHEEGDNGTFCSVCNRHLCAFCSQHTGTWTEGSDDDNWVCHGCSRPSEQKQQLDEDRPFNDAEFFAAIIPWLAPTPDYVPMIFQPWWGKPFKSD